MTADREERPVDRASARKRARRKALSMLSYRSRSTLEISSGLCGKGFGDDVVAAVVRELEAAGLLDDALLARDMVTCGQRYSKSRSRIYADLCRRGICREIAEEALRTCFDQEREREAAAKVIRKILPAGFSPVSDAEIERAARKLAARGFTSSSIAYAVNEARDAAEIGGENPFS